jgi:ribonuclease HII
MKYTIGIDEVGRGPIAGPVAVGAFVIAQKDAKRLFRGVKESKQLTEIERERWFEIIEKAKDEGLVNYCVTFQSEGIIDKKGLSFAIRTALKKSLESIRKYLKVDYQDLTVLLDGGLRAPVEYVNQKTIIKGDEKEMIIALASICAKVLRDRRMIKLGHKYPQYGFAVHKGYGTKKHYEAIRKHGLLKEHRKSFVKGKK